jgi:exopolysaccharide biosynthesis polyprenyl glycosylphosphotransferase
LGILVALEAVTAAVAAAAVLLWHSGALRNGALLPSAAACLVVLWPVLLIATGGHDERVFGAGGEEYRRVVHAGLLLLAFAGFISYAVDLDLGRGLVVGAVPGVTAATLLQRAVARAGLHRLRRSGRCRKRVVLVGRAGSVLELAAQFRTASASGFEVVGACVTPEGRAAVAQAIAVPVGGLDEASDLADQLGADAVAVTSASETAAHYLRQLAWRLEGTDTELLVAPGLIEVTGPRLAIRPVESLPLLSIEQPRFDGWSRLVKGGIDRGLAALAILLLSPVLLGLALAVWLGDRGPVLYRQQRLGVNGRPFTMLKFRSMVVDADRRLEELREANISDGLLFKLRADPRVTPVGRWLRRLSLDELPQLFNILGGSMSLVGPRPPLPEEVAQYDATVRRRLLVKPGLTGLWQVSGRSDLSWEDSVRLDLRYVENWSLTTDLLILWKTGRAVLSRSGAY